MDTNSQGNPIISAAITRPLQRFLKSCAAPATHDMCRPSGNSHLIRAHLHSSAANALSTSQKRAEDASGQNLTPGTQERDVHSRSIAVVQHRPALMAKRSFRTHSSANDPSLLHIAEGALARPRSPVRIAQFYSGKVLLIRKAHIDAYLAVPEPRYRACGQSKMCR